MAVTLLAVGSAGPAQSPTITLSSAPVAETLLVFVAGPVTLAANPIGSTAGWIRDYYAVNQSGGAVFRLPAADNPGGTVTLVVTTNGGRNISYVAVSGTIALPQYGSSTERGVSGGLLGTGLHTFAQQSHVFAIFPLVNIGASDIGCDVSSYTQSFVEIGDSGITPPDTNEESRLWVAYRADVAMANDGVSANIVGGTSGQGFMGFAAYSASAGNTAPTVNAGVNQTIEIGNSITLTATANDSDGSVISTTWTSVNGGPAPDTPAALSTTVGPFTSAGAYTYTLTATDNGGATGNDSVSIIVTDSTATTESLYENVGLTANPPGTDIQGLNLYTKFFVANTVTLTALRYFRPAGANGAYTISLWTGTNATTLTTIADTTGTANSWVDLTVTEVDLSPGWYIVGQFVPAGQPFVRFDDGHLDSPNVISPSKSLWAMSGALTTPLSARPSVFNFGTSPAFIDYNSLESFDPPYQHSSFGVQPVVRPQATWEPPIFWSAPPAGQYDNNSALTVGHRFRPVYDGVISGVFYWRSMTDGVGDTPTVALYDAAGTSLRQKVSLSQSAYGWNRIDFDSPISVTVSTTYTVAYFSPAGLYAASPNTLPSLVSGPRYDLLASGGKYSTSGAMTYPTNDGGNNTYYYVEPAFSTSNGGIPVVDAGIDQAAYIGDTVILTGNATDDGTIVSYSWTQTSGPTLAPTSPSTATTDVGPFIQSGNYIYRLAVTDDQAFVGEDTVLVTVTDPSAPTTYRVWSVNDEPSPAHYFTGQGTLSLGLTFTVQEAGQSFYKFWLYYNPGMGTINWRLYSTTGTVLATATLVSSGVTGWRSVDVDGGPYALADATTYIAGFKESPDSGNFYSTINYYPSGRITTYDAGPFRLGAAVQAANDSPNVYNTSSIASLPDTIAGSGRNYWIDVEIGSFAPGSVQAQAGSDQTILEGATVTLDGSVSNGDNLTYSWQQTGGTTVSLSGGGAIRTFTAPANGPLTFELTVTDTVSLNDSTDSVTINIAGNETAAENTLTGNPSTEWYGFTGVGDREVLGYAYPFNPNVGTTVEFRVDGNADELKIYRLGWYGGLGARLIQTLVVTPTSQPNPVDIPDLAGGSTSYEAANWTTNATWAIPVEAASGVYLGISRNTTTGKKSYLRFVVTDHARVSDIVVTTADATWQAYNFYGPGTGDGGCVYGPNRSFDIATRAYGWSYRRPIVHREARVNDLYNSEVAFIRFLERNGYDVKYVTHVDLDAGNGLANSKIFMSSGHDEYWSEPSRNLVQAHVASGKYAIFSSGNEVFWRVTQHPSNPDWFYCRKDTMPGPGPHVAGTAIDAEWGGTWRDTRWGGRQPENQITGTTFRMNGIYDRTYSVDASIYGSSPFWRNTTVGAGTNLSVSGVVGFEADEYDPPAGAVAVRLSATLLDISGARADDNGQDYGGSGNMDHGLVLFQYPGKGITLGMGTCQWSWGLDDFHDRGGAVANPAMKQATINILSDMGAQPSYVENGLTLPTPVGWAAYGLTSPTTGIYDAAGNQLQAKLKKVNGTVVDLGHSIGG